jgi:hypothetical protein
MKFLTNYLTSFFLTKFLTSHVLNGTTSEIQHRKCGPNSVCVGKGALCKPDITRIFFGSGLHFGSIDRYKKGTKSQLNF